MARRIRRSDGCVAVCIIGIFLILMKCEESLPSYQSPSDLLAIRQMQAEVGGVERSTLVFDIKGVNNYDDTLQDTARVSGTLDVWFPSHENWRITLPITNADLKPPSRLIGRLLTIDPGDTFRVQVSWNLLLQSGEDILVQIPDDYFYEKTGTHYTKAEDLKYQASFTLFRQAGYMESPVQKYEFKGFWKDPMQASE